MQATDKHNERIAKMTFISFFPHYLKRWKVKAEQKKNYIKLLNG